MRRPPNEVVDFRFNLTGHVLHASPRFYPVRVRSRVLAAPPARATIRGPGANYSPDSPRIVFRRGHDQRPVVATQDRHSAPSSGFQRKCGWFRCTLGARMRGPRSRNPLLLGATDATMSGKG